VIGVAGLPGSGKGVVVEVCSKMDCGIVVMGDEIRNEANLRGLKPTPENIGKIMLEMRQTSGPAIVAKLCVPKIQQIKKSRVIIDGIRSLDEVEELKKHFPLFKLVAIHSSPQTRYRRLVKRKRSDDPSSQKVFAKRDRRELQVGLGDVIAYADLMIINESKRETLEAEVKELLENVMKDGKNQN
jgi:dephospho-CoA kinase